MKRIIFILCILGFFINAQAQILFQTNFETEEEFNQFTTYDVDGNKPMIWSNYGSQPPYKAWIRSGYRGVYEASSTSWYEPLGQSNDWLVSPAITIPIETNATLQWIASGSVDEKCSVYVSLTGNKVEDFIDEPVYSSLIELEKLPTQHTVSLNKYAGRTIHIAWVNETFGSVGSYLSIHGISIESTPLTFDLKMPAYVSDEYTPIKLAIHNHSGLLTSFTVKYVIDGQNYSQLFENLHIEENDTYEIELEKEIPLLAGQQIDYEVWIVADKLETSKQKASISRLATIYPRKVVFYERVGTWCGWCPRGDVVTKDMKEKYPNSFIAVAVHDDDPMSDIFGNGGFVYGGDYPSAYTNLHSFNSIDTDDFESEYEKLVNENVPAKISLLAKFTNSQKKQVKVDVGTEFSINGPIFYETYIIVIENNVRGTEVGYNQANSYSGGKHGEMGGYENLPNPVPASQMVYHDVARAGYSRYGDGWGYEEFPTTVSAGKVYSFSHTFSLPSTVNIADNIEVIALLVDSKTGDIINADKVSFQSPTSNERIESEELSAFVYKNTSDQIITRIETSNEKEVSIIAYNSIGQVVASIAPGTVNGIMEFVIPIKDNRPGIYFISITVGQEKLIKKVLY